MNQPSPVEQTTPELATLDQRVSALHDAIRSESPESSDEPATEPTKTETPAAKAAPVVDTSAERRARLDALKQKERDARERNMRRAEQDKLGAELQSARKRADDAEARAATRLDRADLKDPLKVIRIMGEEGVPAARIAEAIRESIANPERAAEAMALDAARKAVDPEVKSLKEKLAELDRRDAEREQAWQRQQAAHAEQQAAQEFFTFTNENAAQAPYASAFLARHGGEEFYRLALSAASNLHEGAGWQPILDVIEENLSALVALGHDAQTKTSNGKALPPKKAAAAKATTTVTNSLAQERASVVEEDDWSSLPFEERVARMKR